MTGFTLGVDIGGTKTSAAAIDDAGSVVGEVLTTDTPARDGPNAILDTVVELARTIQSQGCNLTSIGIGSAGTIDAHGTVSYATDILSSWTGTRISARVAVMTGLPVVTLNDVHAAGYGEARLGAAKGSDSALVVAIGTGVSGAIIRRGVLMVGRGGSAGSIGHIPNNLEPPRLCSCGVSGHVEAYASGPAMERAYFERFGQAAGLRDIASRASQGDADAIMTIRDGAIALGRALATAGALIDPDIIVLGGGVVEIGDQYLEAVRAAYRANAMAELSQTAIVPAALGTTAALVGAALYARSLQP